MCRPAETLALVSDYALIIGLVAAALVLLAVFVTRVIIRTRRAVRK